MPGFPIPESPHSDQPTVDLPLRSPRCLRSHPTAAPASSASTPPAQHFASLGWEVVILTTSPDAATDNLQWLLAQHPEIDFHRVDIRQSDALADVVGTVRPSMPLHLAAQVAVTTSDTNPREDFEYQRPGLQTSWRPCGSVPPRASSASTNKEDGRYGHRACGDDAPWLPVPGIGHDPEIPVSTNTTTLFASDRDVFVFLVDDRNPIEVGKLANGEPDLMFRGFMLGTVRPAAKRQALRQCICAVLYESQPTGVSRISSNTMEPVDAATKKKKKKKA